MNTFGNIYRLTTFGESHGKALGGIIDGMPAGLKVNTAQVQEELDRRRPGQSAVSTSRTEPDQVKFLSGIFNGVTLGTPIGFTIANTSQRSNDYEEMRHIYRPSHADYTYQMKYGIRDHRGGGRSSARETASRIVAGSLARQALAVSAIDVRAWVSAVGPIKAVVEGIPTLQQVEANIVRCPDPDAAQWMERLILDLKKRGDSVGGVISCCITGVPAGLGDPVFGKLQSRLASAMLSINAAKGFDYGMGFEGCCHQGSEMIDNFITDHDGHITTASNHSGGIQGGISNGQPITFRVGFKPVATLLQPVKTVDDCGRETTLDARGRHDPCVLPRAVPIVEAMASMVIFDSLLLNKLSTIGNALV